MSTKQTFHIAGVDGCKAGWFVIIASATRETKTDTFCELNLKNVFIASTFAEVLSKTSDCSLVCVDIPIGLSDAKPRRCDTAARRILERPRASSVFPAPIRPCLSAKDYETASRICFKQYGKRLNKQSFFILDKIRQVDDLMTPELQHRVREVHPEISFWALNGKKPIQPNKKRHPGHKKRLKLLSGVFPEVEGIVNRVCNPKEAGPDDILDALVAVWTAGQVVIGKAGTLPQDPELDSKGLRMEILCPDV